MRFGGQSRDGQSVRQNNDPQTVRTESRQEPIVVTAPIPQPFPALRKEQRRNDD